MGLVGSIDHRANARGGSTPGPSNASRGGTRSRHEGRPVGAHDPFDVVVVTHLGLEYYQS